MNMDISELSFIEIKNLFNRRDLSENETARLIELLKLDKRKNVQLLSEKINKSIEKQKKEASRIKSMYEFDRNFGSFNYIAGVDEVGRGPFAGPIVAAAVILDLNNEKNTSLIAGIKDSKALTPAIREVLAEEIKQNAIAINIALINNKIIDEKGVGWCNNEVLKKACTGLKVKPNLIISDGFPIKNIDIENQFIIKGDAKSASIACASIVAKVFRDSIMAEYASKYPEYGFEHNSGYGTESHIAAIKKYGITEIHRTSFLKNYL